MAVGELTCMAPGKDAGDGKKRCKCLLSRRTAVPEACRGREGTCTILEVQQYLARCRRWRQHGTRRRRWCRQFVPGSVRCRGPEAEVVA